MLTLLLFILTLCPLQHLRPSTSSCCLFKGQSQALALLTWPAWEGQGPLPCQSWELLSCPAPHPHGRPGQL